MNTPSQTAFFWSALSVVSARKENAYMLVFINPFHHNVWTGSWTLGWRGGLTRYHVETQICVLAQCSG